MDTPERILRESSTLAIVGLSRDPSKSAHSVPGALQRAGFRIVPVNPFGGDKLLDETVYPSLTAVPFPIDVVIVFRPSADVPPIAREAANIGAKALWLQQGITSNDARRIAEEAGMLFVEDRCSAVEMALHRILKS